MSAQFREAAFFSGAEFADTDFRGVTFQAGAHFEGASFGGTTDFGDAIFQDPAVFTSARFTGDATFAIQTPHLDLSDSTFTGLVDFPYTEFYAESESLGAAGADPVISGGTHLGSVKLDGAAFGTRLTFDEGVVFTEISPPGSISGATNLTWNDVKDYLAPGDRAEVLRAWESFFAGAGQPSSARQIRTTLTREELARTI